jgi:hypothetical protein
MNLPRVNDSFEHALHAYAQAPWRIQRQWIGGLLLGVVGLAMVATLYLDVTSRAAIAGREIQDLAGQMTAVQQGNGDLQSRLAEITSTSSMEQRAKALGYQPVDPAQVEYVAITGYTAPKPDFLTGTGTLKPSAPSIPPEYTESLIAWLNRNLRGPASSMPGGTQ